MRRDRVQPSCVATAPTQGPESKRTAEGEVLRFDQFVAELTRTFVRATVDEIDAEINRCLKDVCLLLGLDRATIAQIDPVNGWAAITHSWACNNARGFPTSLDPNKFLPYHKKKMLAGETVIFSNLNELPAEEAAIDRETLRALGPVSSVINPIRVGGVTFGALALGSLYKERQWPDELVEQFRHVADIFGYALERKRSVAELLRLQSELARVSRIATLGELTASLAHELNQPLAAILSNTEAVQFLLRTEKPDFQEVGVALGEIVESDHRATEIIKRFRALFKRGELNKSTFPPGELFDAVRRVIKSEAAIRNISLSVDCPSSLPGIIGDPIPLQQVLLNLILNAFDSVGALEVGQRQVAVGGSQAEPGFVQITVSDNGKGIAPEIMPRLFDPFFTTKPEGMGMGLAVARSIVEAHGGRLWARDNPGIGAIFEFTVPAENGMQPRVKLVDPPTNHRTHPPTGRIKIALIDDDSSQRTSLVRMMVSAGHEVVAFAGAGEFLASPECETFSCVVSDLRMPGLDGLGLQEELRARSPYLPIVFITGDADVPDTVKAMKSGATDFLEKPVKSEVLLEAIGNALRQGDQLKGAAREIDELKTRYQRLTRREREVLALVSAGLLNKQVAAQLGTAEKTIKQHRGAVMRKMEVESLADLVMVAERLGVRPSGADFSNARGLVKRD